MTSWVPLLSVVMVGVYSDSIGGIGGVEAGFEFESASAVAIIVVDG